MKKILLFFVVGLFLAVAIITSANMEVAEPKIQKASPLYNIRISDAINLQIKKIYENRFSNKLFLNIPIFNFNQKLFNEKVNLRNHFMAKTSGNPRVPTACIKCITEDNCNNIFQ